MPLRSLVVCWKRHAADQPQEAAEQLALEVQNTRLMARTQDVRRSQVLLTTDELQPSDEGLQLFNERTNSLSFAQISRWPSLAKPSVL